MDSSKNKGSCYHLPPRWDFNNFSYLSELCHGFRGVFALQVMFKVDKMDMVLSSITQIYIEKCPIMSAEGERNGSEIP